MADSIAPRLDEFVRLPFAGHDTGLRAFDTVHVPGLPISVPLYRLPRKDKPPGSAVLLVHGASAWSRSFTTPHGRGLGAALLDAGHDVWLLDWRGSKNLAALYGKSAEAYRRTTLDDCAQHDVPGAVAVIRKHLREENESPPPLDVVAHCVGAGVTSMAIGGGHLVLEPRERVVLLTLGLFYGVPWDGVLKGDDHILERVRALDPDAFGINPDPDVGFPSAVDAAYDLWPKRLLPEGTRLLFRRLAFMFGQPYSPENLSPEVHDDDELRRQFGYMHLRLYQHGTQNVRRGFAAPFDAQESEMAEPLPKRARAFLRFAGAETRGAHSASAPRADDRYLDPSRWKHLDRVTLVTGQENALWHRTSIDSMHEFLRRELSADRCRKHVFAKYGHQDLLWGTRAHDDVFPTILDALRR